MSTRKAGPRTRIKAALVRAERETQSHDGGVFGRGVANEGYAGGYAQALRDVLCVLNGVRPSSSWGFWNDWEGTP